MSEYTDFLKERIAAAGAFDREIRNVGDYYRVFRNATRSLRLLKRVYVLDEGQALNWTRNALQVTDGTMRLHTGILLSKDTVKLPESAVPAVTKYTRAAMAGIVEGMSFKVLPVLAVGNRDRVAYVLPLLEHLFSDVRLLRTGIHDWHTLRLGGRGLLIGGAFAVAAATAALAGGSSPVEAKENLVTERYEGQPRLAANQGDQTPGGMSV